MLSIKVAIHRIASDVKRHRQLRSATNTVRGAGNHSLCVMGRPSRCRRSRDPYHAATGAAAPRNRTPPVAGGNRSREDAAGRQRRCHCHCRPALRRSADLPHSASAHPRSNPRCAITTTRPRQRSALQTTTLPKVPKPAPSTWLERAGTAVCARWRRWNPSCVTPPRGGDVDGDGWGRAAAAADGRAKTATADDDDDGARVGPTVSGTLSRHGRKRVRLKQVRS